MTILDGHDAEAWYGLGITHRLLAEAKQKSATREENAAQKNQDTEESQALMDDFEKSVRTAMRLDIHSVQASMILGELLRIAEQYDEAIREYKTATERAPQMAATTLRQLGRPGEATAAIDKFIAEGEARTGPEIISRWR